MAKMPVLMIILGSPACGKTTLARRLAADLQIPCLCKDDIKEPLFDVLGSGDREWSRRLSDASFAALMRLAQTQLETVGSCIMEGNWRPLHAPPLLAVMNRLAVRAAQIQCVAPPEEVRRRFLARTRHAGHLDAELLEELDRDARAGGTQSESYLELPGPRIRYAGAGEAEYGELLQGLKSWRM